MKQAVSIVGLFVCIAVLAAIWRQWGPLPGSLAARVNGASIPQEALAVFVRAAQRSDADVTPDDVLKGLIENRLLAELADKDEAHRHDHGPQEERVGYDAQTQFEQQRFRLLRTAFAPELHQAVVSAGIKDGLDYLTAPLALNESDLASLLAIDQALYSTMTPEQEAAAQAYVLARYRFAEHAPEREITLWDLYRRQNIQLKVQMHTLNFAFMKEAIKQYITMDYVAYWFEEESAVSGESVSVVYRCIRDAMKRNELLHSMGLMHDIHDDNARLRELAAAVTPEQIAQYYEENKHEFTRVTKVKARHLRVNSQQEADSIVEEVRGGMAFDDAVSRYSVASDKDNGGELGWIDRESRQSDWIRALAFVQPEGQVSPAFRSPGNSGAPYWEILWVDERVTEYQPVDSESVRYRAARAVAQEQIQQGFKAVLEQASAQADLRVNRIDLPALTPVAAEAY